MAHSDDHEQDVLITSLTRLWNIRGEREMAKVKQPKVKLIEMEVRQACEARPEFNRIFMTSEPCTLGS